MLASSHWYSSPLSQLGAVLAVFGPLMVIAWLMLRSDSGARGALLARWIALAIFVVYLGAAIWLGWHHSVH